MALIQLTKGYIATVDEKHLKRLLAFSWYASEGLRHIYGARASLRHENEKRHIVYLHHQVLDIMPWELDGREIDHKNRNTLDCQEDNLRVVTHSINMQNSKRAINRRGVSFDITHGRWKAYLDRPGKNRINLGTVGSEEAALALVAKARDRHDASETKREE